MTQRLEKEDGRIREKYLISIIKKYTLTSILKKRTNSKSKSETDVS